MWLARGWVPTWAIVDRDLRKYFRSPGLLLASLFLGSSWLLNGAFPPLLGGVSVFGALGCLLAIVLGGQLLWSFRKNL